MNNSKHPIFPMQGARHTSENPNEPTGQYAIGNDGFQFSGLTKREYFAAMAMQGLLANPELFRIAEKHNADALDIYTKSAIQHADELLKQLES